MILAGFRRSTAVGTDSSSNTDVRELLHRLRSTLARLKGELELAELDGHPFAPNVLESVADCLNLLRGFEDQSSVLAPVHPSIGSTVIHVLDDDPRLAEITARQLVRAGWPSEAHSTITASVHLGTRIVIDLGLLEKLTPSQLNAVQTSQFIVVSGTFDLAAPKRAVALGASAYFTKPVDIDLLVSALKDLPG